MTNQASIKLVLGVGLEATHLLPNIQPTSVVQTPRTPWLITFFHIRRLVFSPWRPWSILSLVVCSLPSKYWYDASWLPCNLERPGSYLDLWPEDPLAQIQCLVSYISKRPRFFCLISIYFNILIYPVLSQSLSWARSVRSSGLRRITFEGVSLRRLRWLRASASSALEVLWCFLEPEACAAPEQMRCPKFEGNRPGAKLPISHSAEGPWHNSPYDSYDFHVIERVLNPMREDPSQGVHCVHLSWIFSQ